MAMRACPWYDPDTPPDMAAVQLLAKLSRQKPESLYMVFSLSLDK
jgi:hypothetical protein